MAINGDSISTVAIINGGGINIAIYGSISVFHDAKVAVLVIAVMNWC